MWNWKGSTGSHPNKATSFYNQASTLTHVEVEALKTFICPKCKRFYDIQIRGNSFSGKVPLILPCEHTICEECLRFAFSQKSKEVLCGECHAQTSLENTDFKTKRFQQVYPVNFYIFGLLYYYKPHTSETSQVNFKPAGFSLQKSTRHFDPRGQTFFDPNTSCFNMNRNFLQPVRECTQGKCKRQAQVSCSDCDEVFCGACCDTLHKSARGLMKHKISPLSFGGFSELKEMCPTHKDNLLEFHCKTCIQNLCCYCILGAHKDHDFYQVTEMDAAEIPEFKAQIEEAEEMLKKLQLTGKKVSHYLNTTTSNPATNNNSIDITISRCFENLHAKLQILEKQLRKEAADYKNLNYNALTNINNTVCANIFSLTSLIQAGKKIVEGKHDTKMNVKIIQERLANALKQPCYLVHNKEVTSDTNIELICGNLLSDLKDNFSIKSDANCSFQLLTEDELPDNYVSDEPSDDNSSTASESVSSHNNGPFLLRASSERLNICSVPTKRNRTDSTDSRIQNVYEEKKLETEMPKFRKGDRASVIVTHIDTPECFYIHLTSMQAALKQLSKNIEHFIRNFATPVAKPELNVIYLVKYERQWYRGRIININEEDSKYTVLFIDFGNTGKVKKQFINGISAELCGLAPFSKMCKLFDLYPPKQKWDPNATKLMAHIIVDNEIMMVIMDEDINSLEVDLITLESNTSIRDALMFTGYGIPHISTTTELDNIKTDLTREVTTQLRLYEKIIDYTKEKTMDVVISFVIDPHNVYVNLHKVQRSLNDLHDSMLKFYKENKKGFIYAPKKDMVVAVSYVEEDEAKWYRGIITDVTEGRGLVTVYLVDIGNTISIPWNYIKRLNERFIAVECQAILVKLADIKPKSNVCYWSQNSIHYFDKYVKEKLVLKMVVSQATKPVEVVLFECFPNVHLCINALLVKENLAESTGDLSLTTDWPQYESTIKDQENDSSANFTMNMMKTIQSSTQVVPDENIETSDDEEGNIIRKSVDIISATDPDLIYVKFTDKKQEQHEFNLEFQDYYSKNLFQFPSELKLNDPYVIYYDKQYNRGIITEMLPENKFDVYLIDVGSKVVVTQKQIGLLDAKFKTMRNFAIRCHLGGIIPAGGTNKWSAMAREYLEEFFNNKKDFYLAKYGDINTERKSMPVKIWYREIIPGGALESSRIIYQSINKLLCSNGLALKTKVTSNSLDQVKAKVDKSDSIESPKKYKIDTLEDWNDIIDEQNHENQETLQNFDLESQSWLPPLPFTKDTFFAKPTFVNDMGEIFLHDLDMDPVLENMETKMTEMFKMAPPEPQNAVWLPGHLCSVKYFANDKWYRGKVLNIDKDSVKVIMIDYGNEEDCTAKDLSKKVLFLNIPPFANKVFLHNVIPKSGKWQTSDLDLLHAHIVEKIVTVTLKHENEVNEAKPAVLNLGNVSINQFMLTSSTNLTVDSPKLKKTKDKHIDHDLKELHQVFDEDILSESVIEDDSDVIVEEEDVDVQVEVHCTTDVDDHCVDDHCVDDIDTPSTNNDNAHFTVDVNNINEEINEVTGYTHLEIPNVSKVLIAIINVFDFNKVIFEIVDNNSDKELFDRISKSIQIEGNSQPILKNPQVGMPCIAKFSEDGAWYRAQIFHVNSENIIVWFVDFGNFENLTADSIREIKPDWLQIPVAQYIAEIYGIKVADDSYLSEVFEDMFSYFGMVMTAEIVSRSPLSVRLFVKGTDELSYQNLIDRGLLTLSDDV